jgi:integrase/recombinase XerD
MDLPQLSKRFLNYCSIERQLSENTGQAYRYDLDDFQRWLPIRTELAAITTDTLRGYLENMRLKRQQSAATIRRRIACLRAFFHYLEQEGLTTDPFVGWRLKLPRRKRLPRALTREEAAALLSGAGLSSTSKRRRELAVGLEIALMVATGIRVGELCKLQISDVSPDMARLQIRGKGSKDRIVYVTDPAVRRRLQKHVSLRLREPVTGSLFLNRRGSKLRPHAFRSELRVFAKKSGIGRRVTPHMLRHTAATLLIESGVDIRIVQRLLGHSSIATTEIYTHVSDETLRRTLERANVIGELAA